MEGNNYIACLMDRIYLEDGIYLYKYNKTVFGELNEKTGEFVDSEGNCFPSIDYSLAFESPAPFGYANIFKVKEILKDYNMTIDTPIDDLLDAYAEEFLTKFCISCLTDERLVLNLTLDYDEIIGNYLDKYGGELIYQPEKQEEIENKIEENKNNKEELKQIKNKITNDRFRDKDGRIKIENLVDEIKKTLIGQDEPTKRMVTEIARLEEEINLGLGDRTGILLTGAPGMGKTKLMRLIAKNINKPFVTVDSTQLTSAGYEGKNIEQCLWELYEKANHDKEKAERGIIFFDEIDKKGSTKKDDVAGKAVLNALLKFLDGTIYNAAPSQHSFLSNNSVELDTSKMIVVAGGSFTDVYGDRPKDQIGFYRNSKKEYTPTMKDFVEKGMMTYEFMGRVPIVIRMNTLNTEKMTELLDKSNESPILVQKKIFKDLGVNLDFTSEAKRQIAEEAIESSAGARGLSGIVKRVTYNPYYEVKNNKNKISKIIIDDETIKDSTKYKVLKRDRK